jgi:hypothetical protein
VVQACAPLRELRAALTLAAGAARLITESSDLPGLPRRSFAGHLRQAGAMQKSLLDWLVELMQRDYPEDWARLCHLAHAREQAFTELIAFTAKHRIEQLAREPTQMLPGLLGLARPAQDQEVVGVAHDAGAEASLQPEHLLSQHDLDPVPSKSPEEEAARTYLRSYQKRGALYPIPSVEMDWLCAKFIKHFADVFRDQMVGRKKGTRKVKPIDPALVRSLALRFDPDELVLDIIIVDVRVEPAPSDQYEADGPVKTTRADGRTRKSPQSKKPLAAPSSPPAAATAQLPDPPVPAESQSPKRRRSWQRDVVTAAIEEKFGLGWPPGTLSTPEALRQLDRELDRLNIKASDDTKKRAMGRRD